MKEHSSVGIPSCRMPDGRQFSAGRIGEVPCPFEKGQITCGGCDAAVVAVKEHLVGQRLRRAHFRLAPRRQHEDDCPYDYERCAKTLAHEHHSVVSRDKNIYLLRLNAVSSSGSTLVKPAPKGVKRTQLIVASSSRYGVVQKTVQAAAAIARLLRTFEHSGDAVERWQGIYGDVQMSWDRFYYRADEDGQELAERLAAGKPDHPLAVSGRVHSVVEQDGKSRMMLVTKPGARTPGGVYFNVVVRSTNPRLLSFGENDHVLAYGSWSLWQRDPQSRCYATLWVNNSSQIALL